MTQTSARRHLILPVGESGRNLTLPGDKSGHHLTLPGDESGRHLTLPVGESGRHPTLPGDESSSADEQSGGKHVILPTISWIRDLDQSSPKAPRTKKIISC